MGFDVDSGSDSDLDVGDYEAGFECDCVVACCFGFDLDVDFGADDAVGFGVE